MSELERITIARNIASNGRTFCALLCLICLAVFLIEHDRRLVTLAVFSAAPIGLSNLVERANSRFWFSVVAGANVGFPIVVILSLLFI